MVLLSSKSRRRLQLIQSVEQWPMLIFMSRYPQRLQIKSQVYIKILTLSSETNIICWCDFLCSGVLMGQAMQSHSTLSLVTQHASPVATPHKPHDLIYDDIIITSLVTLPNLGYNLILPLLIFSGEVSSFTRHCYLTSRVCSSHTWLYPPAWRSCTESQWWRHCHSSPAVSECKGLCHRLHVNTMVDFSSKQESSDDFSLPQGLRLLSALSTSDILPSTLHLITSLLLPSPPHPLPNEDLASKLLFHFTVSLPADE